MNFYTLITTTGKAKMANAAALGTKVNFKTLKVGDGNGNYYEPTENQTNLLNTVWQGNIGSISIDENNSNWIVTETTIPATDGGFSIREAGIFDEDGNMIAISKMAETYKPVAAEGSTKNLIVQIILEVSNSSSVTLKVDPNVVIATKNDIAILTNSINSITTQLSDMAQGRIYYCGTTSGTNTYAAANNKITAYTEGLTVRIKVGTASTWASTLNINGLGAKTILDSLGNPITSGGLKAGLPYQLCYNGTNFIVLGKGGGGDATAPQVLINKKVTVDTGQIVGTMPENGSPNVALNAGQSYNLAQGHYSGGNITANSLASQTPATADQTKILNGYSAWVNGNLVNGNATVQSLGGRTTEVKNFTIPGVKTVNLTFNNVPILITGLFYNGKKPIYFTFIATNPFGLPNNYFMAESGDDVSSSFNMNLTGTTLSIGNSFYNDMTNGMAVAMC
ncbi:phage tail protein [uncultured Clostridium sp.]|uniref:phage tail protein n=1 Tax=uncultured Clostridium sp. TaxID=59620 RepID=UPI0028E21B56|nr:phage tail protein [uncultured Clostridium sp.]